MKALVLGASGGMGSALTFELANRGFEVTAFARSENRLRMIFDKHQKITIQPGDVFKIKDLELVAHDVDLIFHAVNLPYNEWKNKQEIMLRNILQVSEKYKAKLAIVDNVYAYGRCFGKKVTEDFPKKPHTKKGHIRLKLEQIALSSKVPVVIAHFPDFYGPYAKSTVLHYMLQSIVKNKRAMFVGNQQIEREFIYTPDGAKAFVKLALSDASYGECWNIPGSGTITGEELVEIIKNSTGYSKKVSTVTKSMVRFSGFFDKMMKEYVEMYYLNEDPLVLDGSKYEEKMGIIPRTTYQDGMAHTLQVMNSY